MTNDYYLVYWRSRNQHSETTPFTDELTARKAFDEFLHTGLLKEDGEEFSPWGALLVKVLEKHLPTEEQE